MFFYYACIVLSSLYSVIAILLVIINFALKQKSGITGIVNTVNRIAGTRKALAFQLLSYAAIAAWLALALPWADLFMGQWSNRFENDGFRTWFGWMTSAQAEGYFMLMFLNILGVKAALTLAELSDMLRKGRVQMIPHGLLFVWMPEQSRPDDGRIIH